MRIGVRVTVAWWARPYLEALRFFAALMGAEIDETKLRNVLSKAIQVRIER